MKEATVMKRFFTMLVLILPAAAIISCAAVLSPFWEQVVTLKTVPRTAGDESLVGTHFVSFLSDSTAVAVNFLNQYYFTQDSGATWRKTVIPSNLSCQQPEAVDTNTVFVGGPKSVVSVTADGGNTWRRIEGTNGLYILSIIDDAHGFFAGYAKLAAWSGNPDKVVDVPLPADLGKGVRAAAAVPGEAVYILSQNGRLFFTADLGKTWTERPLPVVPDRELVFEYLVSSMRFQDKDTGMIFTFDKKQNQWVALLTSDGGATWKLQPVLRGNEGRSAIERNLYIVTVMPAQSDTSVIVLRNKNR
jgi:photosystem II stability/assembly factor-like uncharacterized protein